MNNIRKIQELNKRELEKGVSPDASWHADYRDTAYIYIGGLPFELSEGDIFTIFSQFGEPTFVRLVRDKNTGKSRGFAFLKYEDQRSTDLAVDNLGGATILGRVLRVDHTRYNKGDHEVEEDTDVKDSRSGAGDIAIEGRRNKMQSGEGDEEVKRSMLKEERELAALIRDHDDDDPMKAFLIEDKKEEILAAKMRQDDIKSSRSDHKKRHYHKSHRTRDGDYKLGEMRSSRRHREERNSSNSASKDNSYADEDRRPSQRRNRDKRDTKGMGGYDDNSNPRRRHSLD